MVKAKSQTSVLAQTSDATSRKTAFQARKTAHPKSAHLPLDRITGLHPIIGNRAVQGLFQAKGIQAKLTIGPANDIYEQEADQVADEVMRMPEPGAADHSAPTDEVRRKPG